MEVILAAKGEPAHRRARADASAFYTERFGIQPLEFPDVFAVARNGVSAGCFGLSYGDQHQRLPAEWYIEPSIMRQTLTGGKMIARHQIAELGTRVINKKRVRDGRTCAEVSVALTIQLLRQAKVDGIKYAIFTGDRTVLLLARALHVKLFELGRPNLTLRDPAYQRKWGSYFAIDRKCYGLNVDQAQAGCEAKQQYLSERGYIFGPLRQPQLTEAAA